MGQPAAKKGDQIVGVCTHTVMVPTPSGALAPTPLPHPFVGMLDDGLSSDVNIMGQPAAMVDSEASNTPAHIPTPPGTTFQSPPSDKAKVTMGSNTVKINGKAVARTGDMAETCDEMKVPANLIAVSTVFVG